MRRALAGILALCGCSFRSGHVSPADDGMISDTPIDGKLVDAGPCAMVGASCADLQTLRTCSTLGATPIDTNCAWGCLVTGSPHCAVLVPSGGAVTGSDVASTPGLLDTTLTGTFNDDTGAISGSPGRSPGTGIINGIGYQVRNGVAIFTFNSLHVNGAVSVGGSHPIAFVANGPIQIDAAITELNCTPVATMTDTVGGAPGPAHGVAGSGSGGGAAQGGGGNGGGGGGHGGSGGDGANSNLGGTTFGDAAITVLAGGGAGGGGGGGGNAGPGGTGGGAFQLASNASITFSSTGSLNAGGCGGKGGTGGSDGGGGGGAGGTILLEAPTIALAGSLAVNGGGAGGGPGGAATEGTAGQLGRGQAGGGAPGGGKGGAGNVVNGQNVTMQNGGGGGGVGRMRFNTYGGKITGTPTLSPSLTDSPTTTTQGQAQVQ